MPAGFPVPEILDIGTQPTITDSKKVPRVKFLDPEPRESLGAAGLRIYNGFITPSRKYANAFIILTPTKISTRWDSNIKLPQDGDDPNTMISFPMRPSIIIIDEMYQIKQKETYLWRFVTTLEYDAASCLPVFGLSTTPLQTSPKDLSSFFKAAIRVIDKESKLTSQHNRWIKEALWLVSHDKLNTLENLNKVATYQSHLKDCHVARSETLKSTLLHHASKDLCLRYRIVEQDPKEFTHITYPITHANGATLRLL